MFLKNFSKKDRTLLKRSSQVMYFTGKNSIIPHFPQCTHKLDPKWWIVLSWEITGFFNGTSIAQCMTEGGGHLLHALCWGLKCPNFQDVVSAAKELSIAWPWYVSLSRLNMTGELTFTCGKAWLPFKAKIAIHTHTRTKYSYNNPISYFKK